MRTDSAMMYSRISGIAGEDFVRFLFQAIEEGRTVDYAVFHHFVEAGAVLALA
jgi:hypothetical protein